MLRQSDKEQFGRLLQQQKHFENLLCVDHQKMLERSRFDQMRTHMREMLNDQGRAYVEFERQNETKAAVQVLENQL